jgi:hypothetical protein
VGLNFNPTNQAALVEVGFVFAFIGLNSSVKSNKIERLPQTP